jgi:uncharacterized surface protein with fasciclin (FAS1) repeats
VVSFHLNLSLRSFTNQQSKKSKGKGMSKSKGKGMSKSLKTAKAPKALKGRASKKGMQKLSREPRSSISASKGSFRRKLPNFENFFLRRNNLLDVLGQPGSFTYFVPTNNVFGFFSEDCLCKLLMDENRPILEDLVLYHGFVGERLTASFGNEDINTFLDQNNILVRTNGVRVRINQLLLSRTNVTFLTIHRHYARISMMTQYVKD